MRGKRVQIREIYLNSESYAANTREKGAELDQRAQVGTEEIARQHTFNKTAFFFDYGAAGRPGAKATQDLALERRGLIQPGWLSLEQSLELGPA